MAILSNFIQVLPEDHGRKALRHICQSMEPGGALFILGTILDDSRLSPPYAVSSNLNFLKMYEEGRAYTEGEYRTWLEEVGFAGFERIVVPDGTSIITALKPEN